MCLQALEYINKQGGLPVAARFLARAVALPPSNTSWYMGLSNGAAGLCESRANSTLRLFSAAHLRRNTLQFARCISEGQPTAARLHWLSLWQGVVSMLRLRV